MRITHLYFGCRQIASHYFVSWDTACWFFVHCILPSSSLPVSHCPSLFCTWLLCTLYYAYLYFACWLLFVWCQYKSRVVWWLSKELEELSDGCLKTLGHFLMIWGSCLKVVWTFGVIVWRFGVIVWWFLELSEGCLNIWGLCLKILGHCLIIWGVVWRLSEDLGWLSEDLE